MKDSNRGTPDGSAARLSNSAVLADIAAICLVIFIILIILLHFLRPEYDLRERFISEYAVGAYGFLMTVAFVCLSLGSFVLAIAIIKTRTRIVFYLVSALLFIWSGCILIAAIYPTDLKGTAETTTGHIHDTISLLGFVVIVITTFIPLRLKRDNNHNKFFLPSLLLSIAVLLSFLMMIAAIITSSDFIGLVQRVFITMVVIWLITTARKIKFINAVK